MLYKSSTVAKADGFSRKYSSILLLFKNSNFDLYKTPLLCLPFPLMSNNLISHLFGMVWGFVHFRGCFMLTLVFFSLKYAARGKMW